MVFIHGYKYLARDFERERERDFERERLREGETLGGRDFEKEGL